MIFLWKDISYSQPLIQSRSNETAVNLLKREEDCTDRQVGMWWGLGNGNLSFTEIRTNKFSLKKQFSSCRTHPFFAQTNSHQIKCTMGINGKLSLTEIGSNYSFLENQSLEDQTKKPNHWKLSSRKIDTNSCIDRKKIPETKPIFFD